MTCFAWAPNGSVIAQCDIKSSTLGDAPGSLDLWNASTGKLLRSDRSQRFIGSVAFSPDGQKYVYTTTTGASQQSSTAIARAGIYDLSIHHDQILAPVVLGQWAVTDLTSLDDEAERSRDRLLARLAKSERVARRLRQRHHDRAAR